MPDVELTRYGGNTQSVEDRAPGASASASRGGVFCRLRFDFSSIFRGQKKYNLTHLSTNMPLFVLRLWHLYGMWVAAAIIWIVCAQLVLDWYIHWYELFVDKKLEFPASYFLATFVRAWMFISFQADLLRSCFLLTLEALQTDAFLTYRRMLIGDGPADIESRANPLRAKQPHYRAAGLRWKLDMAVQCFIYFTMDIIPIILVFRSSEKSQSSIIHVCFFSVCRVSLAHICVYLFTWFLADVYLKMVRVKSLLCLGTVRRPSELAIPTRSEGDIYESSVEDGSRNVCLSICSCVHELNARLTFHFPTLAALACGIFLRSVPLIVAAVLFVFLVWLWRIKRPQFFTRKAPSKFSDIGEWQTLGETHFGLNPRSQRAYYTLFSIAVLFQCALVTVLKLYVGTLMCLVMLACAALRHATLEWMRPYGFIIGVLEGLLVAVFVVGLNYWATPAWWRFSLFLVVVRQFGLQRHNPRGITLSRIVVLLMNVILVIVTATVTLAIESPEEVQQPSYLCYRDSPTCSYHAVPYHKPDVRRPLLCQLSYATGTPKHKINLLDFALFSALAYEPDQIMEEGLSGYFPGWWVVSLNRPSSRKREERDSDWTTFFEYSDGANATSVIAVRGTSSPLDILNDVYIWGPSLITQFFWFLGPTMNGPITGAIAKTVGLLEKRDVARFFKQLESYVKRRMTEEPHRQFYLTGHSLGGGLAKLVGSKLGVQAVTISSPGEKVTNGFVFKHQEFSKLEGKLSVTLRPQRDLVPRVDVHQGVVIPMDCVRNSAVDCHGLMHSVCGIVALCGSGRAQPQRGLELPCGHCADMPCPSAKPAK